MDHSSIDGGGRCVLSNVGIIQMGDLRGRLNPPFSKVLLHLPRHFFQDFFGESLRVVMKLIEWHKLHQVPGGLSSSRIHQALILIHLITPSRISILVKSASPKPTIMIESGRLQQSIIFEIVSFISLICPSVKMSKMI